MAPTEPAAPEAGTNGPKSAPSDRTTASSPDAPQEEAKATRPSYPDPNWSTLTDEQKSTAMNDFNKAFVPSLQHKDGAQTEAGPETGPVHEEDQATFAMLNERLAGLQLQIENLKKEFRKIEEGTSKPDDS